ncbi:YiiD C-terminal domain-containing protein [Aliikangiella sp. G2MR2-5]|uniref:YiiD C-terminal domain-containing protein n=1 Tax=Aliikangiella sp. G2MR2-5 TaxID=2788943 RepID=UPI0018ABF5C3|nr:YiiD C-terminal domain-containing protein [Aliikangiella sp. G2MR2-5]
MLQKYQSLVHSTIPLTQYMKWSILTLSEFEITTSTQLAPNINVHGTGFAGSIYAAAMATGWTLLKCWYDQHHYNTELVAAEANIKYFKPVNENFTCQASLSSDSEQYQKLVKRLDNNKSCGFKQKVELLCNGEVCAKLTVSFVFKCS